MNPRSAFVSAAMVVAILFAAMADAMPPAEPPPAAERLAELERQAAKLTSEIRRLREELDKDRTHIWIMTLKNLDAPTTVKALEPMLKEMGALISADIRSNSLVISSAQSRQRAIARLLLRLEIKAMGTEPETDIYEVGNCDAGEVAKTLDLLFRSDDKPDRSPLVSADKIAQLVIIKGPRDVRTQIGRLIAALNKELLGCGGTLVIVKVKHLEAAAIVEALGPSLGVGIRLAADKETNAVIIGAPSSAKCDQIQKMIETMDVEKK